MQDQILSKIMEIKAL